MSLFQFAAAADAAKSATNKLESLPGQSSTLLPDGRTLLLGGQKGARPVGSAYLREPNGGEITQLRSGMQIARYGHTATILPDGRVLILGGIGEVGTVVSTAEVFDPSALTFTSVSIRGITPRTFHTATLITDGHVVIAGGASTSGELVDSLEFIDSKTLSASASNAVLISPRGAHTAALQSDGTVLFWGGIDSTGASLPYGEIFDPASQQVRMQVTPIQRDTSGVPALAASIPQDGDQNVALTSLIALRFTQPLQVNSVNLKTATLVGPNGNEIIKVVPAERGMLAFVTPQNALEPASSYTIAISGAVDLAGTPLADTMITFTTAGNDLGDRGQGSTTKGSDKSQSNPFDSPWRKLPPLMAPPGVTAVSGQALKLNGEPLRNVTFQIGNVTTHSDNTGRFLVARIPEGHQVMWIDATTANGKGVFYGTYEDGVDVQSKKTNVLNYTVWMTALDMAHAVSVPSPTAQETIVSTPLLPGLELHLPAGTVISSHDNKPVTQISITPIPIAQPPFPLPRGVKVPIYFTVQPGGAYLQGYGQNSGTSVGARLFYPNSTQLPPGTLFDFWNYDADVKGWFVYGQGFVAADAKQVVPNPGVVIYEFTGAMVGTPPAPGTGPKPGHAPNDGDPVDLQTGLFVYSKTDLYMPDVMPIQVTRTYRQLDSTSRAFGIGTMSNYDIYLTGDTFPYTYIDLITASGGRVHFDRISAGTSWTDAVYEHTASPTAFYGAQIVWNGNGWTLTMKNGTVMTFPESYQASSYINAALIGIKDRHGNSLSFTRDVNNNLTQVTSPNGRWIQYTYDGANRVTQATDSIGRNVYYTYDSSGRLWTVKDANGGITTFGYDTKNNMTTVQDARQITYLTNTYDPTTNMVIDQLLANGSHYHFNYVTSNCSNGTVSVSGGSGGGGGGGGAVFATGTITNSEADVTDPRGNVRKVYFNCDGYMSSQIFAYGKPEQQTFTYNRQPGSGLLLGVIDPLNRQTSYTYDAVGNASSITRLAGTTSAATTTFTYEPSFNQVSSITDPLGRTTSFGYDLAGNVVAISDPSGAASVSYNSAGQPVSITDPAGNTVQLTYSNGDLTGATDSLGRSTTFFTDAAGRVLLATDSLGNSTQYSWNPLNLLTSVTDPAGNTTNMGWDANGNLQSLSDANQHTTSYSYDNMDRIATRIDPLLANETYQYDGNGNLTQFADRRGLLTTYSYDARDRLAFVGFGTQSGPTYQSTITYGYDSGDRPTSIVDSVSGTVTPTFDPADRLISANSPQGAITYQYDTVDRRTSMTVNGQPSIAYAYDNADHLTQVSQATNVVTFAYDSAGRRAQLGLPNGVTTTYAYDSASQLTSMTYQNSTGVLGDLSYQRDSAGNVVQFGGSFARTGLPNVLSSATYDADNRLTGLGGASLSYDNNGNLLGDGTNAYTWDARNQLSMISGGVNASFQYDAFGRRVSKTVAGVSTGFLYDGFNAVQELSGTTPSANMLVGGLDEIFVRTGTATEHILTDQLGSTLASADSSGNITNQYTYEPFGKASSTGSGSNNSVQYTSRENDGTGLYFYRSRYYNPSLGRFISQDPIGFGGGINFYNYAAGNPTSFVDPLGLSPAPVNLGQGWSGRVDSFSSGQGFEIHVYNPAGDEVGVVSGTLGWIGKHGFPDNVRPPGVPDPVINAINGVNVSELRARGTLPENFRSFRYLGPGRALNVMNVLHIFLDEYNQWNDLEIAGRKHGRSPQDEFCHRMAEAGNPPYYMTSIGPLPNPCGGYGPEI